MGSTSKLIGAIVIALGVGVGGYAIYSGDPDDAMETAASSETTATEATAKAAVTETKEATSAMSEDTAEAEASAMTGESEEETSAMAEETETSAMSEETETETSAMAEETEAEISAMAEETEMAAVSTETDGDDAMAPHGNPTLVIEIGGSTTGTIEIELLADIAPGHVARIVELAEAGRYDNVVFHRVIEGFMAQTGDVEFGTVDSSQPIFAGRGGSGMADLKAEFSEENYVVGTVGMARSNSPDSANSQFFIMFAPAPFLDGQYTVIGNVIAGQDVVNALKKGDPTDNGAVQHPDFMAKVTVK